MNIYKIRTLQEYHHLVEKCADDLSALRAKEIEFTERFRKTGSFYCGGYSWPIQADSKFLLDDLYWDEKCLNFRERMVCEQTHLNNRIRAAIHLFEELCQPKKNDSIYITEQLTPLYQWLQNHYSNLTGSEYLANMNWLHRLKARFKALPLKLNHQDLT